MNRQANRRPSTRPSSAAIWRPDGGLLAENLSAFARRVTVSCARSCARISLLRFALRSISAFWHGASGSRSRL